MAALYGFGMVLSSLFLLLGREAWHTTLLLQEPVFFISGFYFPVRNLGAWVAGAASVIPLTVGLDAMRQLLSGGASYAFLTVRWEIAILAVLSVVFLLSAYYRMAIMARLARRDGKLGTKWQ
jgi:ABC-2 type transport system permease protein